LKANFIYSDLNPCGGGERFTLVSIQAALEMDLKVDLTTLEKPNFSRIENAFGEELGSVLKNLNQIHILQTFNETSISNNLKNGYDVIINTHGDIDPYHNNQISKNNMITYCHYPSGKSLIENRDRIYLEKHLKINRKFLLNTSTLLSFPVNSANNNYSDFTAKLQSSAYNSTNFSKNNENKMTMEEYLSWLDIEYENMIRNSTLITNSQYSKKAIFDIYGIDDVMVLSPPVDVDLFRKYALFPRFTSSQLSYSENKRKSIILVVCRIDPTKNLENAICLAKMLKAKSIEIEMVIAGSLDPYFNDYYKSLQKMVKDCDLSESIQFETNIGLTKLLTIMKKSSIFFHPREGEHFGMSIVEAMSAGLFPVVPTFGGQSEFVPLKYQYDSLERAVDIISSLLSTSDLERIRLSNSVIRFSTHEYKKQFQDTVNKLLQDKIKLKTEEKMLTNITKIDYKHVS
jgi:glycosyltransferase involved in cell wall biosynthesis